ncbi:MAG: 4-(cytidine 5'-diphospho)-2-C-methyl-D-erythritol kinase [Candidatus Omnitrophica bacterium]|nr:4-(cytidine 5'-diphospho)-2-C-methyl-D-erythritol kinase [Candidatus Omnitrophota bacterium]
MKPLTLKSPAKLNLFLRVLNKRKDNYHNIDTVFERIDLSDKIVLKPRRDNKINIISRSKDIPKDGSNLASKSAEALRRRFNISRGVDIKITKRIPVGAGLGGGSSNAAAVLLGLNRLWSLGLSRIRLARIAKDIGSDVPFFIYDTTFAQGRGRGESISALNSLKKVRLWHVLVVPRVKVSTPMVYKNWDKIKKDHQRAFKLDPEGQRERLTKAKYGVNILSLGLKNKDLSLVSRGLFNNLEQATIGLYPQVRKIKETLKKMGAQAVLMSGSGPAVFDIVYSKKEAIFFSRQIRRKNRSWQIFVTRTA